MDFSEFFEDVRHGGLFFTIGEYAKMNLSDISLDVSKTLIDLEYEIRTSGKKSQREIGKKEGYIEASKVYEDKFQTQAQNAERSKEQWKKNISEYEEFIYRLEETIRKLNDELNDLKKNKEKSDELCQKQNEIEQSISTLNRIISRLHTDGNAVNEDKNNSNLQTV